MHRSWVVLLMCILMFAGPGARTEASFNTPVGPEISVEPDSIAVTLVAGETTSIDVHIINSGYALLEWNTEILPVLIPGVPLDLTGVRCLFTTYDNYCSAPAFLVADLRSRGATVDVLDHNTDPYPLLDESYDILWLYALGEVPSGIDLDLLLDWVRSGKRGIYIVGVTYWTRDTVNILADSLGAGMETETNSEPGEVTDKIEPHYININVESLDLPSYCLEFLDISLPAELLASTAQSIPLAACSQTEDDRIVVIGSNLFMSYYLDLADNRLLGNQAFDWLALGGDLPEVPWVHVMPEDGSTSINDTTGLVVTIDTDGLDPGHFSAILRITSNDLSDGTIDIPIELDVFERELNPVLDIMPGDCENHFNIGLFDRDATSDPDGEVLIAALLGNQDFDVTRVIPQSIKFCGVLPLTHYLGDIAAPPASNHPFACPDPEADGYMDMVLEFRKIDIERTLDSAEDGDFVPLHMKARLIDGKYFSVCDFVKVLREEPEPERRWDPSLKVRLDDGSPNPFNPVTRIGYYLPEEMRVKVSVYDVAGRLVEHLFDGVRSEGEHIIEWNAAGKASGVYFLRLTTEDTQKVKRLILLR